MSFFVGIDEAGRGPLAGPVAVGAVLIPEDFDQRFFAGIKDSKLLTEDAREHWYKKINEAHELGVRYAVELSSHHFIDSKGIVPAVRAALARTLRSFSVEPEACRVFLDGSLKAPKQYVFQETIIRGDATVPLISAASVMAKVTRDRYMKKIAKRYPSYGFDQHKGYATPQHIDAILAHGLCTIHRASFCHF